MRTLQRARQERIAPLRRARRTATRLRSWRPSNPRHTAQQQPLEVIVRYPHHPHTGERLTVVRRLLYAGAAHFVVELPDGDRLLLPAWMTETGAAADDGRAAALPCVLEGAAPAGRPAGRILVANE